MAYTFDFIETYGAFMHGVSLRTFSKDEIMAKRVLSSPCSFIDLVPNYVNPASPVYRVPSVACLQLVEIVDWMFSNHFKRGLEIE